MTRNLMLLPSLACQAHCRYCFGPNRGEAMPVTVFDAALEWIDRTTPPGEALVLTFHGGEPLLAGKEWYRRSLPLLKQRFGARLTLHLQSNLWLLDDAFCELLHKYEVHVATSLDGPEEINDRQRGAGYFERCMAGIGTARRRGLSVGVICTFTPLSAPYYRQVFDFFAAEGLTFSVHEAVCALGNSPGELTLPPDEAAGLMVDLFDYYLETITRSRISTFDRMARVIAAQEGGLCTFRDCLGKYLTISPGGEIFSCNRFVRHPAWQLGSIFDCPDTEMLARSEAWQKLRQREQSVPKECGDCTHFEYCMGGCPYNAITCGMQRDPYCTVYRQLFDYITTRALDEVFSGENLEEVIQHGTGGRGLLHNGRLIELMEGMAFSLTNPPNPVE
jgi:uncharacterized protein